VTDGDQSRVELLKAAAMKFGIMGMPVAPAKDKRVYIHGWSKLTAEDFFDEKYKSHWQTATGIGLVCGKQSNTIGLDIDLLLSTCDKVLLKKIVDRLPPILSGKSGNPDKRPTQFFRYNGEPGRKFTNIHVEILSDGNQTIIPPSRHPEFNKEYEWVGTPLYNLDPDDLPTLPDGFIDFLEELNESMKPQKSETDKTLIAKNGRCKSGSHNKLSALAVALFHDNYPFDRLVKRMIEEDRKINHDADYLYFNCPSRPWKNKGEKAIQENATDFVEEIFRNYGPGGKNVKAEVSRREFEPIPEQETKNEIELLTLKDLLNRPDEAIPYLVEGLLPAGGTSIMAAKPKVGKTTLLRQLSFAVATGDMFLNRRCAKGPVIYFSVEEKIDEIKNHFRDMGATGEEEIYIFAERAPSDTIKKLKPILQNLKPSLVILDTLFKIVRMKDENSYAAISEALEPLQELARESGAHVMCVHHAGKADREGADGILGSTAILGAFDTAIIMNRKDKARTIKTIQRYGTDLDESTLLWDKDTRRSMLGQENWKVKADERKNTILEFMRSVGQPLSFADLKEGTGIDTKLLRDMLQKLVEKKQLSVRGIGTKGDPKIYSIGLF
jgi:hypothetical protein